MARKLKKSRLKPPSGRVDRKLLALALTLTFLGLVAVADASAPTALRSFSDKFYFVKQQTVWGVVGLVMMFVFSQIKYTFWEKLAVPMFGFSLLLLILVLFPYFGPSLQGARRWIVFGSVSFQPSELIKLSMAVYLAKVAANNKRILAYLAPLGVVILLVMLEPDLGTSVILAMIGFGQLFLSGARLVYLAGIGLFGFLGSSLLILASDYRRDRLITFFEQTTDPLGKGYHIRQILFALGSGGLIGVGLGQSRQKYLFLPEAATDSIFAVIAEEVGFVGATLLILAIVVFLYRGVRIMSKAPDMFSRVLAGGIVAWIGGQSFVNIAAMVAIVPLTGIPLPFISYGGSSLTMVLIATGILLNISAHEKKDQYNKKKRK